MVDFQFMNQLQGPVVPINLYADNYSAGIAAGNALPTPTTAIINGFMGGYKQGQAMRAQSLQNEISQNTVDQLPVANQAQQAEADRATSLAKIAKLQEEKQTVTQDLDIVDTKAKLENDTSKAKAEYEARSQSSSFVEGFQAANLQQQKQMLLGGKYTGLFAENPKLEQQSAQTILNQIRDSRDPQDVQLRDHLSTFVAKSATADFMAKRKLAAEDKYNKAYADYSGTQTIQEQSLNLKIPPEYLKDVLLFKPTGSIAIKNGIAERTSQWKPGDMTNYVESPDYQGVDALKAAKGFYDVFDRRTGEVLKIGAPELDYKNFTNFHFEQTTQNDQQTKWALDQVDKQAAAAKKQSQPGDAFSALQTAQGTQGGQASASSVPKSNVQQVYREGETAMDRINQRLVKHVQQKFQLPDDAVTRLTPALIGLNEKLSSLVTITNPDDHEDAVSDIKDSIRITGRDIAYVEYDKNPSVVNPIEIQQYNDALRIRYKPKPNVPEGFNESLAQQALIEAYRVDDPKEYYYQVKRRPIIERMLNDIVTSQLDVAVGKATKPVTDRITDNTSNQFLSSLRAIPSAAQQ